MAEVEIKFLGEAIDLYEYIRDAKERAQPKEPNKTFWPYLLWPILIPVVIPVVIPAALVAHGVERLAVWGWGLL